MTSSSSTGGNSSSTSVCRMKRDGGLYALTPAIAALRWALDIVVDSAVDPDDCKYGNMSPLDDAAVLRGRNGSSVAPLTEDGCGGGYIWGGEWCISGSIGALDALNGSAGVAG